MLGDKINFGDAAAWKKARAQLDENKEYISDEHIIYDDAGTAAGGYYEVAAIKENQVFQKESRIAELQTYLDMTDWYIVRRTETGALIPAEVLERRKQARTEISELREDK